MLVVLRFGTAMALIDEYIILGGFNRALPTYTWTVYMWDDAFQIGDWFQGYAAAIGWIGRVGDAGRRRLAVLAVPVAGLDGVASRTPWPPVSSPRLAREPPRPARRRSPLGHDRRATSCWWRSCW